MYDGGADDRRRRREAGLPVRPGLEDGRAHVTYEQTFGSFFRIARAHGGERTVARFLG